MESTSDEEQAAGFFWGKKYYCQEALTITIYEYKNGTCYLNLY